MRKGQLKFYKAGGAAQFRLIPPRVNEEGYLKKEGAVLLEAAPGTGRGRDLSWDWSKKITFAISTADIMQMFNGENVDIFHQSEETPKKLMVVPGKDSGWFMTLAEGKGSDRHSVSVALTEGEWKVLRATLLNMASYLCGWERDGQVERDS